jgi:hypothetical protein
MYVGSSPVTKAGMTYQLQQTSDGGFGEWVKKYEDEVS